MRWLIYGQKGWIGSYIVDYLKENYQNIHVLTPTSRADDMEGVQKDLQEMNPDRVLSCIGRTSGQDCPSVDYLELPGKLVENVRDNLYSPLILMKLCQDQGIHLMYLGTGCIFSYLNPDDPPFTTEDRPNFTGSSYSTVKGFTDQLTKLFPNVLNVRIRMPIMGEDNPRNFISKILRYPKIYNTLNSMTVLEDAIPAVIKEVIIERTGTINLVNPGPIDHVTILELYRKYVNNEHTYTLIEEDQHNQLLKSQRSKNTLVPSLELPLASDSIEAIFKSGSFKRV